MKKRYNSSIKPPTAVAPEVLQEINEIKRAFKNVDQIKAGKLKGRPAEELLNKL